MNIGPGHWHLLVWDEPGPVRGTGGRSLGLAGWDQAGLLQSGLVGSRRTEVDVWTASQEFIQLAASDSMRRGPGRPQAQQQEGVSPGTICR